MSKSTNLIKKFTKMSNRIETYAGKTGVNDFKYTDKAWVSPDIPYHIMYITDGREIYVTGGDFDEYKSEVIVRVAGRTDFKEYTTAKDFEPGYVPVPFKPKVKPSDVKKGFFWRSFVKMASNPEAVAIEIDPSGFGKVPETYKKVKIKWSIKGKREKVAADNIGQIEKADKIVEGVSDLPITALDEYRYSPELGRKQILIKKLERMTKY